MNPATIDLIFKGISIAQALITAGMSAAPAIATLVKIANGAQDGTITQADLDAHEADLDALISDFNTPIV
jgi:hypothetical protein